MTEWIKERKRASTVERRREFAYEGHVRGGRSMWGFSFPVDADGNPVDYGGAPLNPDAADNFALCLTGEVDGRKVIDLGIVEDLHTYTVPGIIRCAVCSAEVVLDMVMTNTCHSCRSCGKESDYFWHLITARQCDALMQAHEGRDCAAPDDHHTFMPCEADYNSSGQRLAPREQWGWDTGESLGEILNSDWPVGVSRAEYMGEE